MGEVFARNRRARVLNADGDVVAFFRQVDPHGGSRISVIECIADEVPDDLAEPVGIPQPLQIAARLRHDVAIGMRRLDGLDRGSDDGAKVGGSRRDRDSATESPARQVEEIGDQACHSFGVDDDATR